MILDEILQQLLPHGEGGFYERLVGMVKQHLKKVTRRKHFTLEQLVTLLTEIEAVLNSRPLTYVYKDLDSGFISTRSHFLVSNRKIVLQTMLIILKMKFSNLIVKNLLQKLLKVGKKVNDI